MVKTTHAHPCTTRRMPITCYYYYLYNFVLYYIIQYLYSTRNEFWPFENKHLHGHERAGGLCLTKQKPLVETPKIIKQLWYRRCWHANTVHAFIYTIYTYMIWLDKGFLILGFSNFQLKVFYEVSLFCFLSLNVGSVWLAINKLYGTIFEK